MPTHLQDVINRYEQVAKMVNEREMNRLINQVRELWNPIYAPGADVWEDNYHGEGWTEEGAFTLCVSQLAFCPSPSACKPKRTGQVCEAEEMNQVLFRPVVSLVEDITPPTAEPLPEGEISGQLVSLRAAIQTAFNESYPSEAKSVELPKDYEELMHITSCIHGAGIPSELAWTTLVECPPTSIQNPRTSNDWSNDWSHFAYWVGAGYHTPYAGMRIGGCNQHRDIYYVLCRKGKPADESSPLIWRIFDRIDVELEVYDNLAHFIHEQTKFIEERPGGHRQELMPLAERYPPEEGCACFM
ncbi:hypothetical protein Slin14017_G129500 [Septoria linicola]|nr:hypothetical protein Slin14017_G129500 [Septoria linicola]